MNYKFLYTEIDPIRISNIDLTDIPHILSKSQWKKMIKKGLIFCNGEQVNSSYWVNQNTEVVIKWEDDLVETAKPFPLPLEVVYEDDYMAVVNKPPGLPISGNVFKSLQNALSSNLYRSEVMQVGDQFQTCHRLDYSTSGLVVIAKTKACRQIVGLYFEERNIEKYYYAILQGKLRAKTGKWVQFIQDKKALSIYHVLKEVPSLKNEYLSLVELSPKTGRTHQLRIHSAQNGHCIVGDTKYGNQDQLRKGKGLFLAAYKLKFNHPITNLPIEVSIPLPNKFEKLLMNEERRYFKYHPKA